MKRSLSFVSFALIIIIIIIFQPDRSLCIWNFSAVDLPDDVPIWRFAVWRNRAFLAIPNFSKNERCNNYANRDVTLLEAKWPEPEINNIGSDSGVRIFPKSSKAQPKNKCERLFSVTGLDVDQRGRLWVLDSAYGRKNNFCPAKIVIYDLRRNGGSETAKKIEDCNEEDFPIEIKSSYSIVRTNLKDVPRNNLKSLVIDVSGGISDPRGYIGDPGDESIIVYSFSQRKWWKLQLRHSPSVPRVYSTRMAISKKNSLLYMTSTRSQDIFSIDLEESRTDERPSFGIKNITTRGTPVKWHGTKMGSSSGMICDQRGGLHYFLVTEHASVRWDTKHDLKTSSHSVLLQSEQVPCITDYRADVQRNIWGLVNLEDPFAVTTANEAHIKKWKPTFRTVRIYKYNPFGL